MAQPSWPGLGVGLAEARRARAGSSETRGWVWAELDEAHRYWAQAKLDEAHGNWAREACGAGRLVHGPGAWPADLAA